ncbi:MAG: ABC transporter ATP-binding protein [Bdellovibrionales bacterium]|nr:ABC transporter ATP-binding protein [Bdellovibrionales bacterium]
MTASSAPFAVEFEQVSKTFGDVVANDGITFKVRAGTIHGIIGENGAGKSTAMKMLYGLYRPDTGGAIRVDGREVHFRTPQDAIKLGIGMVHQHFMLAGPYTVLDNIILGAEPRSRLGTVDRAAAREKLTEIAKKYGLEVPFDRPVERVPVGVQQRIEILKALYRGCEILILDEPTAVLTPPEVEKLLANLKSLKAEGKTILIITHKLKEVLSFTDEVTVFRQGKVSGGLPTSEATIQKLADLMVGRKVTLSLDVPPRAPEAPVLEVKELSASRGPVKALSEVGFVVRAGEIVGIAGVEGNGQSELLEALFHSAEKGVIDSGTIRILGEDVTGVRAAEILRMGVGFVPEDRHEQGLLLDRSVEDNFILGQQSSYAWYGWLRRRWVRAAISRAITTFDIRPRRVDVNMRGLSGGNQQKVIIAREFEKDPKVLVVAQPTRGVDVGAIEFIHGRILKAREAGVGVLLVSSELDEILQLADRILVLYAGRVLAEFKRGEADEKKIGQVMGGGKSAAEGR